MQSRFEFKKQKTLELLGTPEQDYHDLSPKGSVDESIRPLIADINRLPGLVTTSSCSGRVSVFCEGGRKGKDDGTAPEQGIGPSRAGPGGKGQGAWLYVSHDPVEIPREWPRSDFISMFNMKSPAFGQETPVASSSYIHLKFEPMILHILTASLEDANRVLIAALGAGFRESGAVSLGASKGGDVNPMVAVRSTGYSFDSIIGFQTCEGDNYAMVNQDRIGRFRTALLEQYAQKENDTKLSFKPEWEDAETRRRRKREEGLARQQQLQSEEPRTVESRSQVDLESVGINGMF